MRGFISEFAGSQGSILYRELSEGGVVYLAQRYRKEDGFRELPPPSISDAPKA
jgi:hypothetical protein